ncbi:hypothetical protein [Streptomyces spiramenti]|uniref:Uncharacterized protein n=1 Tax=Streptomyces spiramenti TaxID=2720606 RepID=A0ABX1AF13_9ACTN|nr:hypothetical protein [Streptomyces spiramenti]NJP65699.1 hypothetical protein [Streptomyces spiramenti]
MSHDSSAVPVTGRRVRAAYGVRYTPDDSGRSASFEALELVCDTPPSIVFSCGTDWTLRTTEGHWPNLPAWCFPIDSWAFEEVEEIGKPGLDVIASTSRLLDAVGEEIGTLLEFRTAWVTVSSGDALSLDVTHKSQ